MQLLWRISLFLVIACGVVYVISEDGNEESKSNYTKTVKSLVECMFDGNPTLKKSGLLDLLFKGYGCFCHLTPQNTTNGAMDDIDRICRVYPSCMQGFIQTGTCKYEDIDSFPTRVYEHGHEKNNCTFVREDPSADPCSRFDKGSCERAVCTNCDATKAKDLSEQLLAAINRHKENGESDSTLYEKFKKDPSQTTEVCSPKE